MMIYSKYIIKFLVFNVFFLFFSCSLFERKTNQEQLVSNTEIDSNLFTKSQALILAHDYSHALPFLNRTLEANNSNYQQALLLTARAYDQLSNPEQAILALQEYLKLPSVQISKTNEFTARSLLLKNQSKVKLNIKLSDEKKKIQTLAKNLGLSNQDILDGLNWSLDFNCDRYCIEEIHYFQEIQIILLYIVEQDSNLSNETISIIKSKYAFFNKYLKSDSFDLKYKKEIAAELYDSLQKLKTLDLVHTQRNKIYPSKILISSLEELEKDLEGWHYK